VATLVSGYNRIETLDLDGITVGEARAQYAEPFGIPGDARSTVGGQVVADDFVLSSGDTLVFDQPTGQKGLLIRVA
jgi:hypothetical protein